MTPGVTGVGGGGVNTAGQLNRNNSYLVDGVSNDDTIVSSSRGGFSLEAVREYVVLANQFSAEYGVSSGAIVSVVTRSGTNKNEGRAFYFGRNDALDAQDPFSKAQGSGKAPFSQQRGGGFWGGPILHDRLFYFSSYEGQHIDKTAVVTSTLVPVDQREWPNPTTQHQAFVKFDNQFTPQQAISGRYRIDRNFQEASGIGGLNTHDRGVRQPDARSGRRVQRHVRPVESRAERVPLSGEPALQQQRHQPLQPDRHGRRSPGRAAISARR